MQADEILRASVAELESLGLPENKREQEKVRELLQDELTGKQLKEIETLAHSENSEKTTKIADILGKLEKENLAFIIAKLLTS
jgi:hypothetical protein